MSSIPTDRTNRKSLRILRLRLHNYNCICKNKLQTNSLGAWWWWWWRRRNWWKRRWRIGGFDNPCTKHNSEIEKKRKHTHRKQHPSFFTRSHFHTLSLSLSSYHHTTRKKANPHYYPKRAVVIISFSTCPDPQRAQFSGSLFAKRIDKLMNAFSFTSRCEALGTIPGGTIRSLTVSRRPLPPSCLGVTSHLVDAIGCVYWL